MASAINVEPLRTLPRQRLDRKHVFIFPTRHGVMLGAMLLVILLGSINYDNALGYLLTFLLFGVFLVAILHTYRNLAGLKYLGAQAKPVFAGTDAQFILALDNRGQGPRYSLDFSSWPALTGPWWRRRRRVSTISRIGSLGAAEIVHGSVTLAAPQRGWLALQRVRITSIFPLGILRAWAYFDGNARCLVYPRPEGVLPLLLRGASSEEFRAGKGHGNDDFAGFRQYRPGDPIGAIAWKSFARADTLLVKRFTSGAVPCIRLRWNDCAALGGAEARLSQLTQWVLEAERRGLQYGLEIPQQRLEPSSGAVHCHHCLQTLALYDAP